MLRRVRWLILAAMAIIAAAVGISYHLHQQALARKQVAPPAPLPQNTAAVASRWEYEIKSGNQSRILIRARQFEQIKDPAVFVLHGLEMEIRQLHGPRYDLVKSAKATFRQDSGRLEAEGDVEITLGLSRDQAARPPRTTRIRTAGVSLDVQTSRASTGHPAEFEFDRGSGKCTGAVYDPSTREILMQSEAELDWRSADAGKPPLHVTASRILYREASADVVLSAPTSLARGAFELHGGDAFVTLTPEGLPDHVETTDATGSDRTTGRRLEYRAGQLVLWFTPKTEIRKIEATRQASLESQSAAGVTSTSAARINMEFEPAQDSTPLKRALATGNGRVESRPAPRKGAPPQAPRVLTSDVIEVMMRPGGREIERVSTHAPGQIEFFPARSSDPHRWLTAERFTFNYGPDNSIDSCRAVGAQTRTSKPGRDGKPVVTLTKSKDLLARFDPKTGQFSTLEQWTDFTYEEAARRATASHATFNAAADTILLDGAARMWDESGSTSANTITLDQKRGVMVAEGSVNSISRPARPKSSGGLLDVSDPLNARAAKMTVSDRNTRILYEGDVLLWQAETRLRGRTVVIDRRQETLEASGDVVAEAPDQRGQGVRPAAAGTDKARGFSVIKASSLEYSGKSRLAVFTGGVTLDRQALNVRSNKLRAWFVEEPAPGGGAQTRLDRMFADGAVEVREASPKRNLECSGEHAEHYLAEERIEITGGNPVCTDAQRGATRGAVITWFSRQDKMVVDNSGAGPAVSRVKQKK